MFLTEKKYTRKMSSSLSSLSNLSWNAVLIRTLIHFLVFKLVSNLSQTYLKPIYFVTSAKMKLSFSACLVSKNKLFAKYYFCRAARAVDMIPAALIKKGAFKYAPTLRL